MKLSDLSSAIVAAVALNACAVNQSASPRTAADTRSDLSQALSQLKTDKQGVRANGNMVESTACVEALSQDTGEELAGADAKKALDDACAASAAGGFVPKLQAGSSNSGNIYCVKVKTPVTDTCTGQ